MREFDLAGINVFLLGVNQKFDNCCVRNVYRSHKEVKRVHYFRRHCLFNKHLPEHRPRKLRVAKDDGFVWRVRNNFINRVFRSLPK